ncbi:MAG: integrase [Pelagibacterium sp. SCN 63-23]|nr:MAG: integrase [Pelagibacterium sp. SCN 63-23]
MQLIAHANVSRDGLEVESQQPESEPISQPVRRLLRESLSASTRRGYACDLAVFEGWGGSIPANANAVAEFVAEKSATYAVASISRMLSALSKAHRSAGYADPTKEEIVRATMAGVRRTHGSAQRQARPILREELFAMLDQLGNRPKDIRDRAILLLGFSTALRRAELAALDVEDVEVSARGLTVTVRRSKTDQEGHGRVIAVPLGRTRHCPVKALAEWTTFAQLQSGPIFRGVDKHGHILDHSISGEAVSLVIKTRMQAAGYDPSGFSGHSLRCGFVTAAALAGAASHKIRETTGHKSEASMARYLRQVDIFNDPAIARIL